MDFFFTSVKTTTEKMERKRRENGGREGALERWRRRERGVRGGKGRRDKKNGVMRAQGLKIVIGKRGGGRGGGGGGECGVNRGEEWRGADSRGKTGVEKE